MRQLMILMCLIFVSIPGFTEDKWFQPLSTKEAVAQTIFTGICIWDWTQTLHISRHPEKYREVEFSLGDHPSKARVNTLIPLGIVSHGLVTWALPHKYRPYWQYVWIGIEANAVYTNYRSGIRISF